VLLVAGLVLASGSLILVAAASQRQAAEVGGLESLSVRVRLWQQALLMLNDYPLTGIGLGQVDPVLHRVYAPAFLAPDQVVPHAHNLLLDYALELGVPGAVAFALLIGGCVRHCLRAIQSVEVWLFWTGLGLLLGLLAFMVFGLTDAIAPGARGGLALWAVLGLGAALAPRATLARSAPIPHQDAHGLEAGARGPAPLVGRGADSECWLVRVRTERDDCTRLESGHGLGG
jgi:O-antigen ligase